MVRIENIYAATRGGLDIILDLYPQAKECLDAKNKHFKIRNEKTPSATIREVNGVWKVTDFGGEGRAESPVDLYMRERGIDRFPEAVLQLAAKYNITDELSRSVNKPDRETRPSTVDEKDGEKYISFRDTFTESELRVLGPLVTQSTVDSLHWHAVTEIRDVSNRITKVKRSNENYPIFARECLVKEAEAGNHEVKFYKIYEPLNPEKQWRFSYWPIGVKPKLYINGLAELKRAYAEFNKKEEVEWIRTHLDNEPYEEKKLPEAFICSGERDSLCARSLGYHPLWFNSETYRLSDAEYSEIMRYTEVLYNIPDIDETGVRKGTELALRYIDIHTIWLPQWLRDYHDNRGKPRKDLRDWMELRQTKKDFRALMTLAMPARFWTSTYSKRQGKWNHAINTACLYNFFRLNGFYALHDDTLSTPQYIHIDGNIVTRVTTREMRDFVRQWVIGRAESIDILNLVLDTPKLAAAALDSLQEIDLDFSSYTSHSQLFFFSDVTIEVTGNGLTEHKKQSSNLRNYVLQENVIPHKVSILPDMFEITRSTDDNGRSTFDITLKNVESKFFGYLINSSRLYWRKELEERFIGDTGQRKAYIQSNPFRIDGEGLTEDEIAEQKQNLLSKMFVTGYMLHRYKRSSRAWAPMAMDNKIGGDGECNGRSGKSFFFKTLSLFMKTVKLSGRNPKLMDNPHVFDQVTRHTEMLLVDDCDRYLNTGLFYDNITSDMTVNPKNNQSFTIPFKESPKIAFTTNFVPADFAPSSEARLLYMVFSDYYHQKTEDNDYLETRSIRDDFGKDLYGEDYTEEEWNQDINFLLQCCRFYLSLVDEPIKIQPPLTNILQRKYKADMGANFEDWAYSYFAPESGHLDTFIVREKAFFAYRAFSGVQRITTQALSRKLQAFALTCPYIRTLNPERFQNSGGRIIRRETGAPAEQGPVEMIYLESDAAALAEERKAAAEDKQQELNWHESEDRPF